MSRGKIIIAFVAICLVVSLGITFAITNLGGRNNVRIMSYENNTSSRMRSSYKYFNGSKTRKINLDEGETLSIHYTSEVSKGELDISIVDGEGNVIKEIPSNTEGNETVKADKDMTIKIRILAEKTGGSYDITWEK